MLERIIVLKINLIFSNTSLQPSPNLHYFDTVLKFNLESFQSLQQLLNVLNFSFSLNFRFRSADFSNTSL